MALAFLGEPVRASDTSVGVRLSYAQADTGDRLPTPEVPSDQAREKAKQILSADEYQPPPKSFIEQAIEWIGEQLRRLFTNLSGVGGSGPNIGAWVLLALLIGLAIFLVLRWRRSGPKRSKGREEPLSVEIEVRRTVNEWGSEAERLEAAGKWKEALRARYRELIGRLIENDVVRDIPGRTTGEYRVEVSQTAPRVASEFANASELFDRAWYGDRPTGPDENEQFRELATLVSSARAHERDETRVGV